jgi:hypothetical protein
MPKAKIDADLEIESSEEPEKKRKYNPKSMQNLAQFRNGQDIDSKDSFIGRFLEGGLDESVVPIILPVYSALKPSERLNFCDLALLYLKDFDVRDLSSSDISDIIGLSQCKILEIRLLATSKNNDTAYVDIVNAIEKIHKREEKLKESLATRRADRIDVNRKGGISIVDLASVADETEEEKLRIRVKDLIEQNRKAREDLASVRNEDS